ncbi:hypothetical protein ACPC54_25910 [Kitasatospora sp. NPDC094028]
MSVRNSALATACCALLLAVPLAFAQSAAATENNGPKNAQEAAACKSVVSGLLGGFGSTLADSACVVRPSTGG